MHLGFLSKKVTEAPLDINSKPIAPEPEHRSATLIESNSNLFCNMLKRASLASPVVGRMLSFFEEINFLPLNFPDMILTFSLKTVYYLIHLLADQ